LIVENPITFGDGTATGREVPAKPEQGQLFDTEAVRSLKKKGAPRAAKKAKRKAK
jgi:hypothetical protein